MLRYIVLSFFFFCYFPYIQILPFGVDSQPNALIIGTLFLLFIKVRFLYKDFFYLLLLLLVSLFLFFVSPLTFSSARSLINYVSVFIIALATYEGLNLTKGLPYNQFKLVIYIWFLVGTVQILFWPDFLKVLMPRGDSSVTLETGRGIVCLTPEPTYYGMICLLLYIVGYLHFGYSKKVRVLYLLLIIQLCIFSRSSMCLFSIAFSVFVLIVFNLFSSKKRILNIVVLSILCFCSYFFFQSLEYMLSSYRFGRLLAFMIKDPLNFIFMDASVNDRFNAIYFSFYGFFDNWGIPHGFDSYRTFMHNNILNNSQFSDFFKDFMYLSTYSRIMSGWGSLFFELGVFAFIMVYILWRSFAKLLIYNKKYVFIVILFVVLLFNAMPLSNALVGFIIGNIIYLSRMKAKIDLL